jgi:alpha-tubulin suppressor-like RCC1 family protein
LSGKQGAEIALRLRNFRPIFLFVSVVCWVLVAFESRGDGTTLIAWGDNESGQTNVPTGLTNAVAVSAGDFYSVALRSDGTLSTWGDSLSGTASFAASLTNIVAVSAGLYHCLALTGDGRVVGWGDNQYGEVSTPAGWSNIVAISAGAQ